MGWLAEVAGSLDCKELHGGTSPGVKAAAHGNVTRARREIHMLRTAKLRTITSVSVR